MTTATAAPQARFVELQAKLLDYYHVKAESRFVRLKEPAMTAHVLEAGQGQPLVILHGGDGEAVNWAPFLAKLQDDFHLYAVDRPGFGLSDAFDYRTVNLRAHAADFVCSTLDALGIERLPRRRLPGRGRGPTETADSAHLGRTRHGTAGGG